MRIDRIGFFVFVNLTIFVALSGSHSLAQTFPSIVTGSANNACNGIFERCARIYGDNGQEFFLVSRETFREHATNNFRNDFDAGRGITKLFRFNENRYSISKSGSLVRSLGQIDKPYYVIPICRVQSNLFGSYKKRKEIRMPNDGEYREILSC